LNFIPPYLTFTLVGITIQLPTITLKISSQDVISNAIKDFSVSYLSLIGF